MQRFKERLRKASGTERQFIFRCVVEHRLIVRATVEIDEMQNVEVLARGEIFRDETSSSLMSKFQRGDCRREPVDQITFTFESLKEHVAGGQFQHACLDAIIDAGKPALFRNIAVPPESDADQFLWSEQYFHGCGESVFREG